MRLHRYCWGPRVEKKWGVVWNPLGVMLQLGRIDLKLLWRGD